jgi:DNA-binding protein H-NS
MSTPTLSLNTAVRVLQTLRTEDEMRLELLAEAALMAQQKAKEAEEAAKAATDAFRQALEAAGKLNEDTKAVGIVRTTLYPTRRFSEDLARSIMTKKLAKECEKTVLDSNAVKRNVSPADYERMQSVTGWTMKLSVDKG